METDTLAPTSTTPGVSLPDSHPSLEPSQTDLRPESPPLPVRPLNPPLTTPSFILTPLPIPTSNLRLSRLITPLPETLNLRPPPTPEVFRCLKPQFHPKADVIPTVGGADLSDKDEDEDRENRTPSKDEDLLMLSLRSLTPHPTPMTQLIDHVSALCVDWSAISPGIAHSTCVADASQLSLDIHLRTALTSEGLTELRVGGLVRVQTLCWMITIMTMNLTKISEENAEKLIHDSGGNADFLFVGADLRKVQRFEVGSSVYGRMAEGWQPTGDRLSILVPQNVDEMLETVEEVLSTLMLQSVDEMPDTWYDYDSKLYGDGES
ncbi:hypothetical protein Moror_15817 [Moniliophthora roreri MCA 2997]|uniref:Uncharacterized protein n=1 Tax=Moniliophthora roreri (strain MCA 2997) TaxID=1381753 RepID=V2WLM4_MONRO|nr:hypothetical protein Moror_15817 [Moniliophthora roreri MCA 2997]